MVLIVHGKLFFLGKALLKFGYVLIKTVWNFEREIPQSEDCRDGKCDGKESFFYNPARSAIDARFRKQLVVVFIGLLEIPAEFIRIGRATYGRWRQDVFNTGAKCHSKSIEEVTQHLDDETWLNLVFGMIEWLIEQYRWSSKCGCAYKMKAAHHHGLRETFRWAYHIVFESYWLKSEEEFKPAIDEGWMLVYVSGTEVRVRTDRESLRGDALRQIRVGSHGLLKVCWTDDGLIITHDEKGGPSTRRITHAEIQTLK